MKKILLIAVVGILLFTAMMLLAVGPSYPYSVTESWTLSTTPLALVAGQNVYRAPYTTSCGSYTLLTTTMLPNNATNYTDNNVVNGNSYCYATTAFGTDGVESTYSNIDANVAIPPAPQTGLTHTIN